MHEPVVGNRGYAEASRSTGNSQLQQLQWPVWIDIDGIGDPGTERVPGEGAEGYGKG